MSTPEQRIACFGGIYSNHLALSAALADARRRGVDAIFCLGDFGGFGPSPNHSLELLRDSGAICIQGNYDNSIGNQLDDCQCGYTDPRDNHYAQVSYEYTLRNTAADHRTWMRSLPESLRFELGAIRVLLSHGSPRKMNEFLWESTTSTHFLEYLADHYDTDLMLATHTGIKWERQLMAGRRFVNVGVLGRPENDGAQNVWYTLLERVGSKLKVEFVPVEYDHMRLAAEMRTAGLPEEFAETIVSGWWTTCLEVLPSKERKRGAY
ncbi:MAG: metallophosphoesterase family protein [Planctomycetales bacterium]|nr:metallophosphoesterase family protein [Planctomycetales bacterium]